MIEHCHLDQRNDEGYYETEELLKEFGVLDATAVAKYYGLKSEVLGVDYSNYQNVEIPVPTAPVKPDETEPDISIIEVTDVNPENGDVEVVVSAEDYDSYILYYSYSYDGGANFSELQRWEPKDADTLSFTMNVPSGTIPEIVVNVYNGFDGFTESNHVSLPSISYMKKGEAVEAGAMTAENSQVTGEGAGGTDSVALTDNTGSGANAANEKNTGSGTNTRNWKNAGKGQDVKNKEPREITVLYFLQVVLVCAAILLALFLPARILFRKNKKKKKRKK